MTLLQLVRHTLRVVLQSPLAWLCAFLVVLNDYIFGSVLPPFPQAAFLNCIFTLLSPYLWLVTSVGLIVIGSEPPPHERLTFRRLFLPHSRVALRFAVVAILLFLASIPAIIPATINNVSRAFVDVGSLVTVPHVSPWWTIPLAMIVAPFVITLEMAQRDLVINRSGLTSAIRHVWPHTLQAFPLLFIVVGLGYLARFGASSLAPPLSSLLLIPLIPFFSVLATRAFVYLESRSSETHHGAPA